MVIHVKKGETRYLWIGVVLYGGKLQLYLVAVGSLWFDSNLRLTFPHIILTCNFSVSYITMKELFDWKLTKKYGFLKWTNF